MYSSCDHDLVRKAFDTMPERNVVAWNTLVAWYVKTERYEEAVKQFRMRMRMRIIPSSLSFVNVFPAISAMRDYRWIKITGFLNCFISRDQKHPQCSEIYGMLVELTMMMKEAGYRPSLDSHLDEILGPHE
ncbi:hypothetical protein ACLB2K_050594 [Fragaria x ananassa]